MSVARRYERHYSWSHPIGEHALAHKDGAVSLMLSLPGVDGELLGDDERLNAWRVWYRLVHSLPADCAMEIHCWREPDRALADCYLARESELRRAVEFSAFLRRRHAEHLARYARGNQVAMVLVRMPARRRWWRPAAMLAHQAAAADALLETAGKMRRVLGAGRLCPVGEYCGRIAQSLSGRRPGDGRFRIEPQLLLSEQLIVEAPRVVDGAVEMAGCRTKVALLHMYPDVSPGWAMHLLSLPATLHVCQVILGANTQRQMQRAERAEDLIEGMASRRGRERAARGINDLAAFRRFVVDHDLQIFRNCYLIHIRADADADAGADADARLSATTESIAQWLQRAGGEMKTAAYMQLPFFRAAQPGQGYRSPLFRPDHSWQVADMMPLQVYRQGVSASPESLRLGTGSQLVGFSLSEERVAHSFTVAMTGAGKGVDKGMTILETFPFGIDWYIAEVGQSYRWVVEACGGVYTTIDPDRVVVNPMPPFSAAREGAETPLDAKLVGGTITALAFLLTGGATVTLNAHQNAAAQLCLQMLYADRSRDGDQPTLAHYAAEIDAADYFHNAEQRAAAAVMAANLGSFLSTTEGRLFSRPDNLVLSERITGVDLKEVSAASPELLKFYMVFLSVRMGQLAACRATKSRILLDEMHVFAHAFPEVIGALISGVARMGRKDLSYIDIVTQGIQEIDCIEAEVLNSMPLRTLLYRPDGHDEIAGRIAMRPALVEVWKRFPYPEKLDYRPGLRSVGDDWHNLHLVFSPEALAMVDTSCLERKNQIAECVSDPKERIAQFYEQRAADPDWSGA